jgi:hypothetical protein
MDVAAAADGGGAAGRALRALCRDGAARARGRRLRAELTAIVDQLDRPLQLAVAGAVSAGKSTLINAVLGRAIAPVDAGECTRIVTWYEYGGQDKDGLVIVEHRSGQVTRLRLDDRGALPAELGVSVDEVVRLRVRIAQPWLRTVTVIDTPGMNTVSVANEEATRRLLFGDSAAEHAQALVYVLRHVQRFDADTLRDFRQLSAACGLTAVNTAAVLSQIDRRGDEADPWPTARRLAARAADELRGTVIDVAPVAGLLAETGRARLLGPGELAALRAMAALDPDELADALLDLDEFSEYDLPTPHGPVPATVCATLLSRLHRFGIDRAVDHVRRHPDTTTEHLHTWLTTCSGFATPTYPRGPDDDGGSDRAGSQVGGGVTVAEVLDRFARHAEQLKAYAAVVRLRGLGRLREDADRELVDEVLDAVDEGRPATAGLRELRVLTACAAYGQGRLRLDDRMGAELVAMARGDTAAERLGLPPDSTAAELVATAREASRRWRQVALLAGPTTAGHRATDVLGLLEDLAAELTARPTTAPAATTPTAGSTGASPIVAAVGVRAPVVDRESLAGLLTVAVVGEAERAAVTALLDLPGAWLEGAALAAVLGGGQGEDRVALAGRAAELAGRFRALSQRPLPRPARSAVLAACDAYEELVVALRSPAGPASASAPVSAASSSVSTSAGRGGT